jgi:hypothetical protein
MVKICAASPMGGDLLEGDGSTSLTCTHMNDSFRVHGDDDHSHCTMMKPGDDHRGFANATDRWLCNCGIETAALHR